jgi:hypothetical protein
MTMEWSFMLSRPRRQPNDLADTQFNREAMRAGLITAMTLAAWCLSLTMRLITWLLRITKSKDADHDD